MAIIRSGAGTDELTVDPTSKAARVTLYSSAGAETTALPVSGTVAVSNFPVTQNVAVTSSVEVEVKNDSGSPIPVSAASLPLPAGAATAANQTTANSSLSNIDTKTPALGQALSAASQPVVLPATQITTLTPPAAITGFALEAGHLASIDAKDFATQATLALIKAKTDNLDVLLSTRTKPADSQIVSVGNFPATQPISAAALPLPAGAATAANQTTANSSLSSIDTKTPALASGRVPVDGSGVTQPVSGTFFQATQPVSAAALPLPTGASTEATLSALNAKVTAVNTGAVTVSSSALPSGASTEATLAAIKAKTDNLDVLLSTRTKPADSQHVTVDNAQVEVTNDSGNPLPVSGTIGVNNFPATQPVSIAAAVTTKEDFVTGRTAVLKTGTLVTTAVTADQVILTYTVTAGKTFYLCYIGYDVRLTAISATASILGNISLEAPSGTKVYTTSEVNPTTSETAATNLMLPVPIPFAAATVVRFVCTPAAVTSMTWIGNFGGYEL